MRKSTDLTLAALTAAFALAIATGIASANRSIETGSPSSRLTSSALTFTEGGGEIPIICAVSMGASLHSRIAKTEGALAGLITEIRINEAGCRGGRLRPLTGTLPWHITYKSFDGTLPSIESVRLAINRVELLYELLFSRCLVRDHLELTTTGGTTITGVHIDSTISLPLFAQLGATVCPANIVFEGSFSATPGTALSLI